MTTYDRDENLLAVYETHLEVAAEPKGRKRTPMRKESGKINLKPTER